MATRKICDRCQEIWDPAEHMDTYKDTDMNSCTVTLLIPHNRHKHGHPNVNRTYEVCQKCARRIHNVVEGRSQDDPGKVR